MGKFYDKDWLEIVGGTYGYRPTDDGEMIEQLLEGLNANEGNCPCIPRPSHNPSTICPCKVMRKTGNCHCGLFQKMG
jgi:ferredoxin-thioredoxin reductase catalytic subunit